MTCDDLLCRIYLRHAAGHAAYLEFSQREFRRSLFSGGLCTSFFVGLGIIILFFKEGKGWEPLVVLFGILGITAVILPMIKYPEERVLFWNTQFWELCYTLPCAGEYRE